MHILIAPNAYKNSITANDAANAILQGLQLSGIQFTAECFPIADGGDGTGELIIQKCKGEKVFVEVSDPLGRRINSHYGLIDNGKTAIIEMADASGLRLLHPDELNPLKASSVGTGQLITAALDHGVSKIIIAMGGSATVDGGCGILHALGIRFYDALGYGLSPNPETLLNMVNVDASQLDERISGCEIVVLCDVNNMLLGPEGAAAVFGPQKGASADNIKTLEAFLTTFSRITEKVLNIDMSATSYSGTAGGAATALQAYLNAKLVNGIEYFLNLTGFEASLSKADLLITGEGSIDLQTLQGKGPFGVAKPAKLKKIPVIGLAGQVPLTYSPQLQQYFDLLLAIGNSPVNLPIALENTKANLIRTSATIGMFLSAFGH